MAESSGDVIVVGRECSTPPPPPPFDSRPGTPAPCAATNSGQSTATESLSKRKLVQDASVTKLHSSPPRKKMHIDERNAAHHITKRHASDHVLDSGAMDCTNNGRTSRLCVHDTPAAHAHKRMSPFLNTPIQRKEEKRKIRRISIQKLRRIEDPEPVLRRYVLVKNTLRKVQRELSEEKPWSGYLCYGGTEDVVDEATRKRPRWDSCSYDVLNNSYLYSNAHLFDDHIAQLDNEKLPDDYGDTLARTVDSLTMAFPETNGAPSPAAVSNTDITESAVPSAYRAGTDPAVESNSSDFRPLGSAHKGLGDLDKSNSETTDATRNGCESTSVNSSVTEVQPGDSESLGISLTVGNDSTSSSTSLISGCVQAKADMLHADSAEAVLVDRGGGKEAVNECDEDMAAEDATSNDQSVCLDFSGQADKGNRVASIDAANGGRKLDGDPAADNSLHSASLASNGAAKVLPGDHSCSAMASALDTNRVSTESSTAPSAALVINSVASTNSCSAGGVDMDFSFTDLTLDLPYSSEVVVDIPVPSCSSSSPNGACGVVSHSTGAEVDPHCLSLGSVVSFCGCCPALDCLCSSGIDSSSSLSSCSSAEHDRLLCSKGASIPDALLCSSVATYLHSQASSETAHDASCPTACGALNFFGVHQCTNHSSSLLEPTTDFSSSGSSISGSPSSVFASRKSCLHDSIYTPVHSPSNNNTPPSVVSATNLGSLYASSSSSSTTSTTTMSSVVCPSPLRSRTPTPPPSSSCSTEADRLFSAESSSLLSGDIADISEQQQCQFLRDVDMIFNNLVSVLGGN